MDFLFYLTHHFQWLGIPRTLQAQRFKESGAGDTVREMLLPA